MGISPGSGRIVMTGSSQGLLLRADLHQVFDYSDFVLVPKQDQGFVLHFLNLSADLLPKYNNQKIHLTNRLSGHCLLVRFAWAIFRQLQQFGDFVSEFRANNRIYVDESAGPVTGSGSGSMTGRGKRPASDAAPNAKRRPTTRSQGMSRGISGRGSRTNAAHEGSITGDNETVTPGTPFSMKTIHDDSCESCEEREDQRKIQAVCGELREVEHPSELDPKQEDFYHEIVVYPGHRRVERMKERALEERRPAGYDAAPEDERVFDFEMEV